MTYDYYIRKSTLDGAFEAAAGPNKWLVARLHTEAALNIFIVGASALGLSVYNSDAEHGLCGTLDQLLNEGAAQ